MKRLGAANKCSQQDGKSHTRRPYKIVFCVLLLCSYSLAFSHQNNDGPPVILAPGYSAPAYDAPEPGTYDLPVLGKATNATYVDSFEQHGVLQDLFRDRVTVLSFIYTQCDDVNGCPLATFVMGQTSKKVAEDPSLRDQVRFVSFSFDIEKDSPEALRQYGKSFVNRLVDWNFVVSPNYKELESTLKNYKQSIVRNDNHTFAHILRVFLIDSQKNIRNIYSTSFLHTDTLLADVRSVLIEQGDLSTKTDTHSSSKIETSKSRLKEPSLGLPQRNISENETPTEEQINLGEQLFFDRRLSLNKTISCAMCHIPSQGFTSNELSTAVGIEGRTVKRNAPTLLNVGFLKTFFHDARENKLEQQVWSPLLAENEMGNPSVGYVIDNLKKLPEYRERFKNAYDGDINMLTVGSAFAAYQQSLIAGGSDFDHYYYNGNEDALTERQKRGFAIFRGKGQCSGCHTIGSEFSLFSDEKLHNTGMGYQASMQSTSGIRRSELAPGTTIEFNLSYVAPSAEKKPNDLGRYEVTENPSDRWKFRTPSLRNVSLTSPYMHNGSLSTLEDVVAFYNEGGISNPLLDPLIKPLALSDQEQADLVTFLQALTSPEAFNISKKASETKIRNPGEMSYSQK